ncbi:putative sorting nexin-27 [Apostichopus japonicus]|uniref:Putative sorting nexin-27 n=1 Tax=Stichopus japonicus TaxID=307972 RepID=A0A2G8L5G3_STIJA|nr:putative sorting nexin-27 [Apostichopus japonicus]
MIGVTIRNGTTVEGATHKFVVDLIKEGGDSLTLTVISVPNYRDQERTENSEDSSGYSNYDYSDRKPLPITVPDYQSVSEGTDKFVVYNVYMSGKLLVSHRYSQFADLHNRLKREFVDYVFPKFPGKWPFSLSEQQLDSRRRALEHYVEKEVDVNRAINGYQRTDSVKQAVRSYNVIERNAWLFDRNWPVLRICDIKAVFLH